MKTFKVFSPAKINLYLAIHEKGNDGYHTLDTIFEKIDLCDILTIALSSEELTVRCDYPGVPSGERNLVYRAASRLRQKSGVRRGAIISIEKRIPVAAGLGGGSSNAGVALRQLNALWKAGLSDNDLIALGKEIGADVPFFVSNYTYARGQGRGDELTPIEPVTSFWHLMLKPDESLSTREVYHTYDAMRRTGTQEKNTVDPSTRAVGREGSFALTGPVPDATILVRALRSGDINEVRRYLYNDLEGVVRYKVKKIGTILDMLKDAGFPPVHVSGSGPTLYVLTGNKEEAETLHARFSSVVAKYSPAVKWQCVIARTHGLSAGDEGNAIDR